MDVLCIGFNREQSFRDAWKGRVGAWHGRRRDSGGGSHDLDLPLTSIIILELLNDSHLLMYKQLRLWYELMMCWFRVAPSYHYVLNVHNSGWLQVNI